MQNFIVIWLKIPIEMKMEKNNDLSKGKISQICKNNS